MTITKADSNIHSVEIMQSLSTRHDVLRQFVGKLLVDCQGGELISNYFEVRSQHLAAVRQDLLPLLVYEATSKQSYEDAMPVTAAWALYLAAAHSLDKLQDDQSQRRIMNFLPLPVTSAIIALGSANMALAAQEVGCEKLPEMLVAIGEVTVNGAIAQRNEMLNGRVWTKQDYFFNIASKSAAILATGMWLGAVLTMEDEQSLTMIRELGLSLGMMVQIADDCLDLAQDLGNGTYTLPVIEALAMKTHPGEAKLKQLLNHHPLSEDEIDTVITILNDMGVITACRRVARAYQVQAAAALTAFPALAPVFVDYVSVNA